MAKHINGMKFQLTGKKLAGPRMKPKNIKNEILI